MGYELWVGVGVGSWELGVGSWVVSSSIYKKKYTKTQTAGTAMSKESNRSKKPP